MEFNDTRSDFMPYGFSCELWSPTAMPRPDRHNEIEGNYLLAGTLTYLLGGRRVTIEAGRLSLFWAALPHQILQWETSEPYYVLTLPLAWFLGCDFPDQLAHPALVGDVLIDPNHFDDDQARFQCWHDDFHVGNPLREKTAKLEIQARLLRLALALPPLPKTKPPPRRHPDPSLSRADQIACYIALHYAETITADEIARAVGLHPNYAMGLFRKAFGTTMIDFVVQHRLSHAQRLLITTDDPIIDIASAAGFQSLSRFNEAFKRSCGCAPRDYRKSHKF